MESKTTAVYPASAISATNLSNAPPPYTVGIGAQPTFVEMQPVQPVIIQPAVVQPTYVRPVTIVACEIKRTEHDHPYLEYCPRCKTTVTTRITHNVGGCWWAIFIIGCFVCWPIWFCLCCNSSKDVRHHCPNCATILTIKKRGC